ncbi:efflux RND transporter periplasmic adaptor subunit [Marinobacter sp. DY40_1A1]|uniref:efflux RND transporter periplasmic adaptor subunit n=1 Tax=Marinobacter sp. DY40_1A1 TaxID=2583229 RepID=UPI001903CCB6|nr:HlyD family efflux transporter periplasmic adaptor subunit [Marinobacter sp. DY40_1A1]MBK1887191.1 HlyD family efflux transporter periplasmic adaptor subunit [Marinobacter sp. DY40_1A1]
MSKRFIPVIILAGGILGFLFLKMTRPEPAQVSATERSWRVQVQVVEPAVHTPVLPLYGEVVAPEQMLVVAAMAGRISERPVAEGQRVSAGDLLVALDAQDVEPVLAQAKAQVADLEAQIRSEQVRHRNDQAALKSEQAILANAHRQLERTRSLVDRNLASRESLESVTDGAARAELTASIRQRAIDEHPARLQSLEARLAQAEAALATTQRDAERSRVVAPFDGVVTDVQVALGDQVSKNQKLLSVYAIEGLELRARVPDLYRAELMGALAQGKDLFAYSDQREIRFRLKRFAGISDPAGTEAILALAGDSAGLRPGALLPVTLERPERSQTVAIPFSALYGANNVYLMADDSRMQRVSVERVGEALSAKGERRLLVAGEALKPGSQLIITHLPNALTGLKVDVASEGSPVQ